MGIFKKSWFGFWFVIELIYQTIRSFFRVLNKYLFYYIKTTIIVITKYFFFAIKLVLKYTFVFLSIQIHKLLWKDFNIETAKTRGYLLGITALIVLVFIFYHPILDHTLGLIFRFLAWIFSHLNNPVGTIMRDSSNLLWGGIKVTIVISIVGTFVGFFGALLVGLMLTFKENNRDSDFMKNIKRFLRFISRIYVTVIRSTPMMVQALIIHFGFILPILRLSAFDSLVPAIIIVSINTTAYLAEIIRGAIENLDKGQNEAARSLGLSSFQALKLVVYPQAVKNAMPAIGNELIVNLKDIAVLTVISISDLFFFGQVFYARFINIIVWVMIAIIYLFLTIGATKILKQLMKKLEIKPQPLPSAN